MEPLGMQIRRAFVRKTLAILPHLEDAMDKLQVECKAEYLKRYGAGFKVQPGYERMEGREYFFEKIAKTSALIYVSTPAVWYVAYEKQKRNKQSTEKSDSAYRDFFQQLEEVRRMMSCLEERVGRDNTAQDLDEIIYSYIRIEFQAQQDYTTFLNSFYKNNYEMVLPSLRESRIIIEHLVRARELITAFEAELIFKVN